MKVYRPQDGQIQVHQQRVTPWPIDIVSGFYWYGRKRHSPGRPPKWLEALSTEPSEELSAEKAPENQVEEEQLEEDIRDAPSPDVEDENVSDVETPSIGGRACGADENPVQPLCPPSTGNSSRRGFDTLGSSSLKEGVMLQTNSALIMRILLFLLFLSFYWVVYVIYGTIIPLHCRQVSYKCLLPKLPTTYNYHSLVLYYVTCSEGLSVHSVRYRPRHLLQGACTRHSRR